MAKQKKEAQSDIPSGLTLRHTLEGHTNVINHIVWSPDGRTLASPSNDRTIRLWDLEMGSLRRTLEGHSGSVYSTAWSPDGQTLASGSLLRTIRLWDLKTGTTHRILEGHDAGIYSVAWSPDGRILASGSEDKTIRIWDLETGWQTNSLESHARRVISVSFSSDGLLLASKSSDSTIQLWCCDSWEKVAELSEPSSTYWPPGLAFHPHAPILATLGEGDHGKDTIIRIWDLDYRVLLGERPVEDSSLYRNAKVVILGDSGVGKSGLGLVLTGQKFVPTESTHGRHVWTFDMFDEPLENQITETRETLLWDMAG